MLFVLQFLFIEGIHSIYLINLQYSRDVVAITTKLQLTYASHISFMDE